MRSLWATPVVSLALSALALTAGCGPSEGSRDDALASLRLTTEAASLQSEMGKLVGDLSTNPSAGEKRAAQQRLASLDSQAADLIASAEADATYDVELRPLNGSGAVGVVTLVENEGKVAIDGSFDGLSAGRGHAVTIHALKEGQGASVCPPPNADTGSDRILSASEAEDFYGRPAVQLGSVQGGSKQARLSASREAGSSPPLSARALVLSGSSGSGGGYDSSLPVACGTPVVSQAPEETTSSTEVVAALNETRSAGVELTDVARNPGTKRATRARRSAATRLDAAGQRLQAASAKATAQLKEEEGSDLSAEDRQAVNRANATVSGSQVAISHGFRKFDTKVAHEKRARQRREAQRRAAQAETQEVEEEATAPAPEATPAPTPEYSPESAPEPAPTPSSPEGPSIVHPG